MLQATSAIRASELGVRGMIDEMRLYDMGEKSMKIDHIQLAMPEGGEGNARRFFSDILGMTEVEKPYPLSERGGCWFEQGSAIIHLGVEKEFAPQGKAHPAFVVPKLNELAAKLIENDYEVIWDDALANRSRFYTSDPFGNRIEFLKDGDGFTQK